MKMRVFWIKLTLMVGMLMLRRWMKMTTTILIIRKDMIFAKNSKDGRDHHLSSDHLRDYCRDHHHFKGFLGPPVGGGLPASSSSSGRWESLLSSAVHRTDSLLPRHLTNRCNKMHLCALQLNKFSSSSLCSTKRNRDSDAKRVCSFWESEASPSHCRPCRGQKIHDSRQTGTIQETLSETEGKKT